MRLNSIRCGDVAFLVGALTGGCGSEPTPRPQLLVVVDTNTATVEQALADPTLSRAATLDTLRVDVLGKDGLVVDFLDVVAPGGADWPISFGVVPVPGSPSVALRVRLFSGRFALAGELDGVPTLEPAPALTIDRVVELRAPSDGIETQRILLDGDCLGIPPYFGSVPTTCVEGSGTQVSPRQGIESVAGVSDTVAGSWPGARKVMCLGDPPPGARCVEGGLSIMGDAALDGLDEFLRPFPLRPVRLSPFFMDETEYTVGRYRAHVAQHGEPDAPALPSIEGDSFRHNCSLGSPEDSSRDTLPLNCLEWATMRTLCQASGGDLPTEAQWEHAARGEGVGTAYPWGDERPACCTMSGSRTSRPGVPLECSSEDPLEPVASHLPTEKCGGVGDVSSAGIIDLAGSVSELTLDIARDYSDSDCAAGPGVPSDPRCQAEGVRVIQRGGNITAGLGWGHSALRSSHPKNQWGAWLGFRCVYPSEGP